VEALDGIVQQKFITFGASDDKVFLLKKENPLSLWKQNPIYVLVQYFALSQLEIVFSLSFYGCSGEIKLCTRVANFILSSTTCVDSVKRFSLKNSSTKAQ